jgi:hypothetical protein
VYRATAKHKRINWRLPVILFSRESVKFPSMWKFYFVVDKNMRPIKKRLSRLSSARHFILFAGANSVRNIARRLSNTSLPIGYLFVWCVGARAAADLFSFNTRPARNRKNMNNNGICNATSLLALINPSLCC